MTTNAPPRFHVMAKPTGAICNLDCAYCFFLDKERLYPGGTFRMSDAVLERYIVQLIDAHRTDKVTVAWQGGEPTLMGLDFYRRALALQEQHRRPGMVFENTIQTNGTRLDDAWCAFLRENHFLVGLSIDGPRALHDRYRRDKSGHGTFDAVMRGLRLLQKHGVEYNLLTTVNRANADHPLEVYQFLRDEAGTAWIQFIPVVERADARVEGGGASPARGRQDVTDRSVRPAQFGRFLSAVFDEWVRHDVGRVFVQTFEAALANWLGLPSSGLCVFNDTCGSGLALEHNGDLYSCDHYVDPAYLLGNLETTRMLDLVASDRQRAFGRDKRDALPRQCRECPVLFACRGECPKNRFGSTASGEPGLNYLCAGYLAFFRHIDRPMKILAGLWRRGLPVQDVMRILATEEHAHAVSHGSLGRNAPCPCGSGRKHKHCHGRPLSARGR